MKEKRLITSALPYVNNVPHLGNIIGSVLSADVFARYCRSAGYETIYICGTDEYGTATEIKALEEKTSPKDICDKYHKIHKQVYEWFEIEFDYFGRTSTENHTKITQEIFLDLYKNGFIVEKEIEQFYDENVKMFLADRYIEGTCPHCGYKEARGDQCDKCGKLLNPTELINPKSKITGIKPILKTTKHLFLDLEKLQPKLEKWIEEMHGTWSENTYKIAMSWINKGLKKRSITRDLKWGVPVPLKGFENKVFYVWFDAPIGYISITADAMDNWKEWWETEYEVNLYQFMGKDNVPFHAVIFPATLIGTSKKWTLVKTISTTEYLNYEGGKFSKSRNVGVFGMDAVESGIPADVWRYYLLINRPEKSDTDFKWNDFSDKLNNELVGNIGNLVNRTITFVNRYMNGEVNVANEIEKTKKEMKVSDYIDGYAEKLSEITTLMEYIKLKEALRCIMEISSMGNRYFQENKPWVLVKSMNNDVETKKKMEEIFNVLLNVLKDLGILIQPFIPESSKKINKMLNIENGKWKDLNKMFTHWKISKPEYLFKKMDESELKKLIQKFDVKKSDKEENDGKEKKNKIVSVADLDIEIGEIIEIKRHPNADKLYVEKIKFSDKVANIISGLVPFFTEEELLHMHVMVIRNLKKAKIRGEISEGMLLAVEEEKNGITKLELLGTGLPMGEKIRFKDVGIDMDMKTKEGEHQKKIIGVEQFLKLKPHVLGGVLYIGNKIALGESKPIKTSKIQNGNVY